LRATHLLGLALGSALGRLRESGATAARNTGDGVRVPCPPRPLVAEDLAAKIEVGLVHYAHFRPHQALGGATPAEMYFGRTPAHLSAIPPPRGRPGEVPMVLPFRVEYLDAERLLPVLAQQAA
jgi:hypothetical protein